MYRSILLGFTLMLGAMQAQASEGTNRLSEFLDGLTTFKANFDQTVATAGGPLAASRGTFYLNRPGRFRWSYTQPEGQQVIADGNRVWLYDPELEQVSHQSQKDALRGTPALLLSDTGPLEEHFELVGLGSRIGLDWVELIPRAENSEITKVLLAFEGQRLDRLEMIDSFGQVTRFRFHNIERNPDLDPMLFVFVPPAGVDVLGQ